MIATGKSLSLGDDYVSHVRTAERPKPRRAHTSIATHVVMRLHNARSPLRTAIYIFIYLLATSSLYSRFSGRLGRFSSALAAASLPPFRRSRSVHKLIIIIKWNKKRQPRKNKENKPNHDARKTSSGGEEEVCSAVAAMSFSCFRLTQNDKQTQIVHSLRNIRQKQHTNNCLV